MFTASEAEACRHLIDLAVTEDLGSVGDLTSQAVIPQDMQGRARFIARREGVLAGLPAAAMTLAAVESRLLFEPLCRDGTGLAAGQPVATVIGPMRGILSAERTALNFIQRLSGVATLTRRFVEALAGLPCHILDTRKTTPGWRLLEKYAVRAGGGQNHRMGLYDGVLLKDNHLAALGGGAAALEQAIAQGRARVGKTVPLEVEVDTLEQLDRALACGPDIILLDNMAVQLLREGVRRRNAVAPGVLLEASGGITLDNVREMAESGVDRISVGALTHSAVALDLALDYR
jgi:nicotinate-nucleotide pyrophosphorylase (carboxylating)